MISIFYKKRPASSGFLNTILEYIDSYTEKFGKIINSYSMNLSYLQAFINRPLGISYILDKSESRNETKFMIHLN